MIENWDRKYYQSGGKPFLCFIVFNCENDLEVSKSKHRVDEIPSDLEFRFYEGEKHATYLEKFFTNSFCNFLRSRGIDIDKHVKPSKSSLVIIGTIQNDTNLNYLRNLIGIIQSLLEKGATGVIDMSITKWLDPKDWNDIYFKHGKSFPKHHVVIYKTEIDDLRWFGTQGMIKFGRPDICVENVPESDIEMAIELINRFIEFQAFGGIVEEGREVIINGFPEGMFVRHKGTIYEKTGFEFNNDHFVLSWP